MSYNQLSLIRQYCDTTGIRLNRYEKDLLCKILENPSRYNGFTSRIITNSRDGRTTDGWWHTTTKKQYIINIDGRLSIYERYILQCDDGHVDNHWDVPWHITKTRDIIRILLEIADEL